MKVISTSADIKTAKCVFVHNLDFDVDLAIKRVEKYPMIVKHYNGYSSVGLTKKSKVYNDQELREQCALMIDEFGGALVEEFIEGKEYTVLIIENPDNYEDPMVLNPIQFLFKNGDTFKYFDLKNVNWQDMDTALVQDAELKTRLMKMAKQAFVVNYGSAYGRMDVRVDEKGDIYFLEINAVPKIFCPPDEMGSADFILKHEPNYNAEKMIYQLISIALKTYEQKQLPYHVFFRDLYGGLGLFAKRDIKKGEAVFSEEEKPIYVVSKSHADKAFKGIKADWFKNYAYPVSDTMYAIWSENPDDWKPINHSCVPNLWYENNTMVSYANREIKKGEELTLDYATFLIDTELSFDCACGEAACRKKFTTKDYLIPEVRAKYNGHFSPYVQDKVDKLPKTA
jgi:D-alanine-D-alanine ligase